MRLGKIKLILGIFIPFLSFFLMSQNIFAINVGTAGFDLNYKHYNESWQWRGGLAYNTKTTLYAARAYQFTTPNITPTGNFATVHFETTMVFQSNSWDRLNFENLGNLSIGACNSSLGHALTIKAQSISYAITPWVDGTVTKSLTIYGDISLGNIRKQQQQIVCSINTGGDNPFFSTYNVTEASQYFESNPMTWNFTDDQTEALLQEQIIQNQYMIQQNHTQIEATYENTRAIYNQNQNNQQYYDANYQAVDDIGNQNSGDISGAENAQTTNLIGILQSFFTEISRFSATSCELTLPFPNFLNGSQTVNICQGKDVLGNFITVISSLALIAFYIPLALVLIKMIYNEIRSWTNG